MNKEKRVKRKRILRIIGNVIKASVITISVYVWMIYWMTI